MENFNPTLFYKSIPDKKNRIPINQSINLEYAIRKVQETNLRLEMIGTHQVLAYADDVNLIGDDIRTIERNADVLLNDCKEMFSSKHWEN